MTLRNIAFIAPALLLAAGAPRMASAQTGWKTEVVGKKIVLTPPDLAAGEFFQIIIHPRVPLGGAPITDFVDGFADREAAALGAQVIRFRGTQGQSEDHTVTTAIRNFVTPQGATRFTIFAALVLDGENARVIEAVSDRGMPSRYGAQCKAIVQEMRRQEKAAALASKDRREAAKAAAEAEAARYKYVVAPGKGVQPAQIAGVFHHATIHDIGQGSSTTDECYLLLEDGTVHNGLEMPPDELDVSLSRRKEPAKWGHWRRQGEAVLVAWPDHPGRFSPLQGTMTYGARPGERLSGRYRTGRTFGDSVSGMSFDIWGVTFTPDGRFLKDGHGGSSGGSIGRIMDGSDVETTYDDDGSVTSFKSPAAIGVARTRKKGGHRAGTYSASGYVLTLHYDDGRVARLPFFFEKNRRGLHIYFEGASMDLEDGK